MQDLVTQYKQTGDEKTHTDLIKQVYKYCHVIVRTNQIIKYDDKLDLIQEFVGLQLPKVIASYNSQKCKFTSLLYRAIINYAMNYTKKFKRHLHPAILENDKTINNITEIENRVALEQSLERLPAIYKNAVFKVYSNPKSKFKDLRGDIHKITFATHYYRGIKKLDRQELLDIAS